MRVAIVSTKGGAGKSTLACLLSCEFERRGLRVALLDADPQGTALHAWASHRADSVEGPVVMGAGDNIASVLRAQSEVYGVVIVDTPGHRSGRAQRALGPADVAVVPVVPSGPGLKALSATLEEIRQVQDTREGLGMPPLRVGLVGNMVRRTALHGAAVKALQAMQGTTYLGSLRLSADVDMAMSGGTACPSSSQATLDLRAIAEGLEGLTGEIQHVA